MRYPLFFLMGLAVLFLNKLRYGLRGYREPRPFAPTDYARAIVYDQNIVDQWLNALHDYTGETLEGKVVLELGPGADLGPAHYKSLLEQNGWYNVEIVPLQTMTKQDIERIRPQLAQPFQHEDADMHILTFLLRATKR